MQKPLLFLLGFGRKAMVSLTNKKGGERMANGNFGLYLRNKYREICLLKSDARMGLALFMAIIGFASFVSGVLLAFLNGFGIIGNTGYTERLIFIGTILMTLGLLVGWFSEIVKK